MGAGAGRVLLFGSVARGDAGDGSDIDLVAIFDDLGEYGGRARRRCALEAKAAAAAGCPVDVVVTDAAEWAVRTAEVPCSAEARIADGAVELVSADRHAEIDWSKEIGLPSNPTAELASRFEEMYNAALRLETHLRPTVAEVDAATTGDADDHRHKEGVRFASAMSEVLAVVESAAKIAHVVSVGTAPPWKHNIPELLAGQPASIRDAFTALAGGAVDLVTLHVWRQSNYIDNRPELPSEASLREHCNAALSIGSFVADQSRRQGLPERDLARWDKQLGRVSDVLGGPIRHQDAPGHGIGR